MHLSDQKSNNNNNNNNNLLNSPRRSFSELKNYLIITIQFKKNKISFTSFHERNVIKFKFKFNTKI